MPRLTGLIAGIALSLGAAGQSTAMLDSVRAPGGPEPAAQATSSFWGGVVGIVMENDSFGRPVSAHRTIVKSRWTDRDLYLLFICAYEQLWLKPAGDVITETFALWEWDVAEAFLGSESGPVTRYREFEVSPRGEWVDLAIDLTLPHHEAGWKWNSGFAVASRIESGKRVWTAEMRIPWRALLDQPPRSGTRLRANFYRAQGPPPNRKHLAWQPTMKSTFHAPGAFGTLRLAAAGGK